jgi:hypothetical protein
MRALRAGCAAAGGLLMAAAFFLPWARASILGFQQPIFSAYDLAQREAVWLLPPVGGALALLAGLAALALVLRRSDAGRRPLGVAILLGALAPSIFLLVVLARLHGGGITFIWLEGATAESLGLTYRYGLFLELLGCLLAAIGGAWLAFDRRNG